MKKSLTFLTVLCCVAMHSAAQVFVEPIAGYQVDLGNKTNRLNMIHSSVQICWKKSRHYELLLQAQRSWPITQTSTTASYTTNPALPVYAAAVKKINPGSWSLLVGNRFVLGRPSPDNIFSIVLYGGLATQRIAVKYAYDKTNYIILNPDQTQQRFGLFMSGGAEYIRRLKTGRLIFQVLLGSMLTGKNTPDYSSFNFTVPLSFNAGYAIPIK